MSEPSVFGHQRRPAPASVAGSHHLRGRQHGCSSLRVQWWPASLPGGEAVLAVVLDHVVLQVLSGAVLRPAKLAGLPGPAGVEFLVSRQHASVEESFVTVIAGEPWRHPSRVTQWRSSPPPPHAERSGTGVQAVLDDRVRLQEMLEVIVDARLDVILLQPGHGGVRVREELEYQTLNLGNTPVGHDESLLQRLVKHRDLTELGEDETQHQLVVGDHAVLAHHDGVHEGVLVETLAHTVLDCFYRVNPL